MDKKKATVQDLIDQAKNTSKLVYEVAGAYVGAPPEDIIIATAQKGGGNDE